MIKTIKEFFIEEIGKKIAASAIPKQLNEYFVFS